jgi:predicted nucleic acid-binding protein
MHADNPASGRQEDSVELIELLYGNSTLVNVDDRGQILWEYQEYLAKCPAASAFVAKMLQFGRVSRVAVRQRIEDARWIGRNVSDPLDKVFLKVAKNSSSSDLVSHDFDDFPSRKRQKIRDRLSVSVLTAREYLD